VKKGAGAHSEQNLSWRQKYMVDVCPTTAAAGDIAPLAVGVFDEGHPVGRVGVGLSS
jgi:hypothetical protein